MTAATLSAACALDLLLGDPEWLPHPVRWLGAWTAAGERRLRRFCNGPASEMSAGAVLTAAIVGVACALGLPENAVWQAVFAWTTLATRSLLMEAGAVLAALEADDLELARRRVARIVGRDTAQLDASEVCRATIETLAESACDGIVAPLFWLAAGGLRWGLAYRAINTLDSMIGHPERAYRYFGRVAARLDDAANFLPARATALAIVAAAMACSGDAEGAWRTWRRDGDRHASPNAGQSEAAMAGALGVRLGGVNTYDGVPHEGPVLGGEGRAPQVEDVRRALAIVAVASGIAFCAALLVARRRRQ